MTQQEKDILLKDLCGRLFYKVKFIDILNPKEHPLTLQSIDADGLVMATDGFSFEFENIKPYLFPLSSMTEEQKEEYCQLQQKIIYNSKGVVNDDITEYINWCYKKHLDINDIISKGLAIDATNKNIY